MQKRNVLNSPRLSELKKRRRKVFLYKIFIFIFGFFAIFALLVYVSRLSNININEIQISGNKVVDTELLKTAIWEQLGGKYLWLFPKTNIFYYPKNKIENELKNNFKRLENISFSIKDRKVLEVSVTERMALYTWCGVTMPTSDSDQKCYFMDTNGYIFDEAPYFSPGVYFKFYGLAQTAMAEGDNNPSSQTSINLENPYGFYFLKEKFGKVIAFKNSLEGMGLKPIYFYLDKNGEANFSLSTKSTLDQKIILKIDSDFEKIAENLQAAITTEPLKSKIKNNFSSLLYIDLKFENKVYYKFSTKNGSASGGN